MARKKMSGNKTQVKRTGGTAVKERADYAKVGDPQLQALWAEAVELELSLEKELLEDAVKSAHLALEELHAETKTQPYERRRGLRLREKAERVERAFNRLRALRKGDLLPARHPDD